MVCYFFTKTDILVTHWNYFGEAVLMTTHNVYFDEKNVLAEDSQEMSRLVFSEK